MSEDGTQTARVSSVEQMAIVYTASQWHLESGQQHSDKGY